MIADDPDDATLAAQALAGRQAAYGALMRRHRDAVYRLARGHVGDADAAMDIVQESFVAAFASLARYDGRRPFRGWIARITINKCHDWARRRAVRRFLSFARPIDDAHHVADATPGADVQIADTQALDQAMRAIAKLPAALKDVLILRTIEEMSQAETARLLGVSEKAVETRLYRARRKLDELLTPQ